MILLIYLIGFSLVYVLDKMSKEEEITKQVVLKRVVLSLFSWITLFLFLLSMVVMAILEDFKEMKNDKRNKKSTT